MAGPNSIYGHYFFIPIAEMARDIKGGNTHRIIDQVREVCRPDFPRQDPAQFHWGVDKVNSSVRHAVFIDHCLSLAFKTRNQRPPVGLVTVFDVNGPDPWERLKEGMNLTLTQIFEKEWTALSEEKPPYSPLRIVISDILDKWDILKFGIEVASGIMTKILRSIPEIAQGENLSAGEMAAIAYHSEAVVTQLAMMHSRYFFPARDVSPLFRLSDPGDRKPRRLVLNHEQIVSRLKSMTPNRYTPIARTGCPAAVPFEHQGRKQTPIQQLWEWHCECAAMIYRAAIPTR